MCTILVWRDVHARYPLVIAANRDEFLERASRAPHVLSTAPLVAGGSDEVAGGTWLAVTPDHIVALANRPGARAYDPSKASRGGLVMDAARAGSFDAAAALVRTRDAAAYNPFALLLADARRALCFDGAGDGPPLERELAPGAHAITNWALDADTPPIAARAQRLAAETTLPYGDEALIGALRRVLADHGDELSAGGLCVHRDAEPYGTRSSAIVVIDDGGVIGYLHAEGAACESRFIDYTHLLRPQEAVAPRRSVRRP